MALVAAGCVHCVQADFCEVVYAVVFNTKLYAVLCNCVSVFHTGYYDLNTGCSLFLVGWYDLHSCW